MMPQVKMTIDERKYLRIMRNCLFITRRYKQRTTCCWRRWQSRRTARARAPAREPVAASGPGASCFHPIPIYRDFCFSLD